MYVSIGYFIISIICVAFTGLFITAMMLGIFLLMFKSNKISYEDNHCPEKLEPKISEEEAKEHYIAMLNKSFLGDDRK